MQSSNFDELTKALAASTSRRHALRLIATASIGGLFGLGGLTTAFGRHRVKSTTSPSRGPNKNCAKWCAQVFGPNTSAAGQCTSDAAHSRGTVAVATAVSYTADRSRRLVAAALLAKAFAVGSITRTLTCR